MIVLHDQKHCYKCNKDKSRNDFGRNSVGRDGLQDLCKECYKVYTKVRSQTNRIKNSLNPDRPETKTCFRCREVKPTLTGFYRANRMYDGIHPLCKKCSSTYGKKYYEANKDWLRASRQDWGSINYAKERSYVHKRYALINANGYEPFDLIYIYQRDGGLCQICGIGPLGRFHLDHWIPLNMGGETCEGNLRITCPKCNLSRPKDGSDLLPNDQLTTND